MKSILTRLSVYKCHHVAIRKCKWWGIELIESRGRRSKAASILMQHRCGHCALSPCSIGTQGAFFSENFHQVTSRSEAEMSRNLFFDFWGLQIEQEKLEFTICQKGTLLSTICQGKKRYSFNYLSLAGALFHNLTEIGGSRPSTAASSSCLVFVTTNEHFVLLFLD